MARVGDAGFHIVAAPVDAWRDYDVDRPDPGYYEFDWLSARHPDLYHRFALSSDALVSALTKLVDVRGIVAVDVGAGTGRSAMGLALTAAHVLAVDAYASVVAYGEEIVREHGIGNIAYVRGDRAQLPIRESAVDAVVSPTGLIGIPT